jgi:hypothetical protein
VATTEELALLRAIVDCDTVRLDETAQTLYETEHLDGREEALAATFRVAVRMQFPQACRPAEFDIGRGVGSLRWVR